MTNQNRSASLARQQAQQVIHLPTIWSDTVDADAISPDWTECMGVRIGDLGLAAGNVGSIPLCDFGINVQKIT